ncbi:M48 family metallopeptidase [Parahaliea aestuarii]|uniref:M48 family metalloprotease n=1 Tax=Parahaliea aestuarii TaxID=1852021 RepID=A0A5C8ZKR0_9GAMM|nr:M48 family metallopeptidase [Parahaliea aestuarii]TXS89156.1 M48 family metalloprotease [Parahaliea aestuarii]
MDFFQQQDNARRNARLLLLLFLFAVLLLVMLTNAVVAAFLWFSQDYNVYAGSRGGLAGFWSYFSWARFGAIGLAITATVAFVVMLKWLQLSTGGKVVAEAMGGSRLLPQTRDRLERRCLNVVEEMALAANMPVPAVYVLNGERGINAFAAGITPADAVIAVTRGTLEHLKRNELQGVIAHEFSHILNGDMRLNIRLAAMLKGITFVGDVGHMLLRSSNRVRTGLGARRGEGGAALPVLGLALLVLGWIGGLAAGFIKAAISRQKEFLADACAVQYTRHPEGIGDALKVIGGYLPGTLVHAARAAEMSHIFFGQIEHSLWQLFATHPPLEQRIRRIDPHWDGRYIERPIQHYQGEPSRPGSGEAGVGRAALVAAALAGATLDESASESGSDADFEPTPEQQEQSTADRHQLPVAFLQQAHNPVGAQALTLALLVSDEASIRQAQMQQVADTGIQGLPELVNTLAPGVAALAPCQRLPLVELCLPALKSISAGQYRAYKRCLLALIRADRSTELFEWCLFQLLRHYLDPEFFRVKPSRPRHARLSRVKRELAIVLSVLAREAGGDPQQAVTDAARELALPGLRLLPPAQSTVADFSRAVTTLADCYPLLKPRVLKAMARVAGADGEVSGAEREIVHSVAAVMDCPVPDAGVWQVTTR